MYQCLGDNDVSTSRLVALGALIAVQLSSAHAGQYRWALSHFALGKTSILLSEDAYSATLRSGWSCEVGVLSENPAYEARTTRCTKQKEEFSFVVQCEANRPRDHTQIMFKSGGEPDYIDVSCAPK